MVFSSKAVSFKHIFTKNMVTLTIRNMVTLTKNMATFTKNMALQNLPK